MYIHDKYTARIAYTPTKLCVDKDGLNFFNNSGSDVL